MSSVSHRYLNGGWQPYRHGYFIDYLNDYLIGYLNGYLSSYLIGYLNGYAIGYLNGYLNSGWQLNRYLISTSALSSSAHRAMQHRYLIGVSYNSAVRVLCCDNLKFPH